MLSMLDGVLSRLRIPIAFSYTTSVGSLLTVLAYPLLSVVTLSTATFLATDCGSAGAYLDLLRRIFPYLRIRKSGRIMKSERPPRRDEPGPRPRLV